MTELPPAGIVNGDNGVNVPVPEVVSKLTVNAPGTTTGLSKASSKLIVIVAEATPVVKVCGAVVKANWLAVAGLTVSCCVVERLPALAVSTGVPAALSVYWKFTELLPAGIANGETGANVPLPEVVLKATAKALLASTGLPNESRSATVIVPEATPAVNVCGEVVKVKWLAAAGLTVTCCVAGAKLPAVAVSTGVPADVSV